MAEKAFWEAQPPRFDADGRLAEFRADLAALGIQPGDYEGDALQLLRDVVNQARGGIALSALVALTGNGMHAGLFWTYLSWLLHCGILMESKEEERFYVLGPYGDVLYKGFRIFGVDADRWRAIPEDADL